MEHLNREYLCAVVLGRQQVVRVYLAPQVLGISADEYRTWAELLEFAWAERHASIHEMILFSASSDLQEVHDRLSADGIVNLAALEEPLPTSCRTFNRVLSGELL